MNWISQVRHVAVKDVRRTRWALIVYVALIAAALATVANGRVFGRYVPSPSSDGSAVPDVFAFAFPLLIVVLGLIVSASLLQLDSPTRANAFWASRPLSPSAVLLAKFAVVSITIVGASLLGVFIALELLDATAAATGAVVAYGAIAFGKLALAAMVLSAITDDVRGAAVLLIALYVGGVFLTATVPGVVILWASTVIGIAGGVSVLVYLYRTRDRRPAMRIAGAVPACLLVASFRVPVGLPTRATPVINAGPALEIEPVSPNMWYANNQLTMQLRLVSTSIPPVERFDFGGDTVTIRSVRGEEVILIGGVASALPGWRPQLGPNVRWIIAASETGMDRSALFLVQPQTVDGRSILSSVASVAIVGTVTTLRSRVIASLPLRVGAGATQDGRRIAIYGVSHDTTGIDLWVQTSAIPQARLDHQFMYSGDGLTYAIFNAARSEAILVRRQSSSGGQGNNLILPWIPLSKWSAYFTTKESGPAPTGSPLDDAWYADARLIVLEWDVVDRYRASGHATLR